MDRKLPINTDERPPISGSRPFLCRSHQPPASAAAAAATDFHRKPPAPALFSHVRARQKSVAIAVKTCSFSRGERRGEVRGADARHVQPEGRARVVTGRRTLAGSGEQGQTEAAEEARLIRGLDQLLQMRTNPE